MREPTTVEEALETLTQLAELDDEELDLLELREVGELEGAKKGWLIEWLNDHDADETVQFVRRLFRVVLSHVKGLSQTSSKKDRERTASILSHAGQAARRLDHLTAVFYGATEHLITESTEVKQLEKLRRRSKAKEEGLFEEPVEAPHLDQMSDLQAVIADLEYELFSMRRDDGQPFLTPDLGENAEIAADFSIDLESEVGDDPLVWSLSWQDHLVQKRAARIYRGAFTEIRNFFAARGQPKPGELSLLLFAACLSLMLAAKTRNLIKEASKKACYLYFGDFQSFLRRALNSRQYKQLAELNWAQEPPLERASVALIRALCDHLYAENWDEEDALSVAEQLLRGSTTPLPENRRAPLAELLRAEYEAIQGALHRFPSGPLLKALDLSQVEAPAAYDPLFQQNLAGALYSITCNEESCLLLRLPTPTRQESISKVLIVPEFREYLTGGALRGRRETHLLVNVQSRLNWKEKARALALEQLQEESDLSHTLVVVTCSLDSAFYQQTGAYEALSSADSFIEAFDSELTDPDGGYYVPDIVKQALIPAFLGGILHAIHRLFFQGRPELSRGERQVFIDLFHLFLSLKLLDLYHPDHFAFVCKDAVDESMAASAGLYVSLELLRGGSISEPQWHLLRRQLHAPALLLRERVMQPHVHERMVRMVEAIETALSGRSSAAREHLMAEELGSLYHFCWWSA